MSDGIVWAKECPEGSSGVLQALSMRAAKAKTAIEPIHLSASEAYAIISTIAALLHRVSALESGKK